jgi:hypothetical protein
MSFIMNQALSKSNARSEDAEGDLIAQIGKLLAKEYIALMKEQQKEPHESSNLCSLFERKPEAAKY